MTHFDQRNSAGPTASQVAGYYDNRDEGTYTYRTRFDQRNSAGPTCYQKAVSHVGWYETSLGGGLKTQQKSLSLKSTHLYRSFGLGTGRICMVTFMCMIFDWVKSMISTTSMIRQFYYYDYYDNSQYY